VAVRGISFDIPERQIVAMLGPNGASKTTMMKILTGLPGAKRRFCGNGRIRRVGRTDAGGPR
jgi:branched-chain amino acid transport system ATP-binding protein